MNARRLRRILRRFSFPIAGWLSAAMYLLVASGVPLSTGVEKDISKPFPCMHSACGCRNAAQCWDSCCCNTPGERLAWARKHGVVPPDELVARSAVEHDVSAGKNCCLKHGEEEARTAASCESHAPRSAETCCAKPSSIAGPTTAGNDRAVALQEGIVVLLQSLNCNGTSSQWMTAMIAVPTPVVGWEYLPQSFEATSLAAPLAFSPAYPPPVPPPRALAG